MKLMEITLKQILNSIQEETPAGFQPGALHRLASAKFPAKAAYRIAKIAAECGKESESIEAQRKALVDKFDNAQNGDGDWRKSKEQVAAFHSEYEEMLSIKVNISGDPIPIGDFGEAEVSPRDLLILDWMLS